MEQFETNFILAGYVCPRLPNNANFARISRDCIHFKTSIGVNLRFFDKPWLPCYHDAGLYGTQAKNRPIADETEIYL